MRVPSHQMKDFLFYTKLLTLDLFIFHCTKYSNFLSSLLFVHFWAPFNMGGRKGVDTLQPPRTGIFILNKPPRPNSWWAQATLPLVKSLKLSFLLGKCGRKYLPHLSHTAVVRIQWVNRLFIYVFSTDIYQKPTLCPPSSRVWGFSVNKIDEDSDVKPLTFHNASVVFNIFFKKI